MIDSRAVLAQIERGNYPSNWHVYRFQHENTSAIILWGCAGATAIISLYSLLSGIVVFFCFLLLMLIFVGLAIIYTKKNANRRPSILAILPTGVIQFDAKNPENIGRLYFPNIAKVELAYEAEIVGFDRNVRTRIYYWLDVYCTDGTYLKWYINECFGDTATIGKSIIAIIIISFRNTGK